MALDKLSSNVIVDDQFYLFCCNKGFLTNMTTYSLRDHLARILQFCGTKIQPFNFSVRNQFFKCFQHVRLIYGCLGSNFGCLWLDSAKSIQSEAVFAINEKFGFCHEKKIIFFKVSGTSYYMFIIKKCCFGSFFAWSILMEFFEVGQTS